MAKIQEIQMKLTNNDQFNQNINSDTKTYKEQEYSLSSKRQMCKQEFHLSITQHCNSMDILSLPHLIQKLGYQTVILLRLVVFKLECVSNTCGGLVQHRLLGPIPGFFILQVQDGAKYQHFQAMLRPLVQEAQLEIHYSRT